MPPHLLYVYDFDSSPVSLDVMAGIFMSQYRAQGQGVHVLFVPGKNNGWRTGEHKPITNAEREWRLTHMLFPICQMAGVTFTMAPSREFAASFAAAWQGELNPVGWTPENSRWNYGLDRFMRPWLTGYRPDWKINRKAVEHAGEWLENHLPGDKPILSMTIRETHTPTRNSNLEAWRGAAEELSKDYRIVCIRDTAKLSERGWKGPWHTCPLASCDMEFRVAINYHCGLNLSRNGGPSMLPVYMGYPYLIFGILAPRYINPLTGREDFVPTIEFMAKRGLGPGQQIHQDDPKRRIIWDDDTAEVIVNETRKALQ